MKFRNKKIILSLIFLVLSLLTLSIFNAPNSRAEDSPDAIAIRVIPNDKHYSPSRWYKDQGFSGSPQSLVVDGYEAIRDGRTVYVNAANINAGQLYTNIYLISYNQEAEIPTVDIFGRILSRWKFNTNIAGVGQCSIAKSTNCLTDANCPVNEYCSSPKATIARDTIRLSRLFEVNESLKQYYDSHNKTYPKLQAGTYLSGRTISAWPSWDDSLAKDLAVSLPKDPINKLGDCGDKKFDSATCWDEKSKTFVGSIPNDLPDNSHVYVYNAKNNGTAYDLCAVMESGYVTELGKGACLGSNVVPPVEEVVNSNPTIISADFPVAYAGQSYEGHIKAYDANKDILSFSYLMQPDWSASGVNPVIAPVVDGAKITSPKVGAVGTYNIAVIVSDGQGGEETKNYQIKVENAPPEGAIISAKDIEYTPTRIGNNIVPIDFSFQIKDNAFNYPLKISVIPEIGSVISGFIQNPLVQFDQLPAGVNYSIYKIIGFPALFPINTFNQLNTIKNFTIKVINKHLKEAVANFSITIKNNPPNVLLNALCPNEIRIMNQLSCKAEATDSENHILSYSLAGNIPTGISIDHNTGNISGIPPLGSDGEYLMIIPVKDEYGYETTKNYSLKINTYCGDGLKQSPNKEGKGGPTDNGQENCDGLDQIAISPADSSINKQYACTEGCVLGNNCMGTCKYTGGYSGDGIVQDGNGGTTDYGEECDDGNKVNGDGCSSNAEIEIGWVCLGVPSFCSFCGDGVIEGPEICDGGSRDCVSTFDAGLPAYCAGIPIAGTQTCKNDCTGWNACAIAPPITTLNSAGFCANNYVVAGQHACCAIISCTRPGCCLDHKHGVSWGAAPIGYLLQTTIPINCDTGGLGHNGGDCAIGRSGNNWGFTINHSYADVICWD